MGQALGGGGGLDVDGVVGVAVTEFLLFVGENGFVKVKEVARVQVGFNELVFTW